MYGSCLLCSPGTLLWRTMNYGVVYLLTPQHKNKKLHTHVEKFQMKHSSKVCCWQQPICMCVRVCACWETDPLQKCCMEAQLPCSCVNPSINHNSSFPWHDGEVIAQSRYSAVQLWITFTDTIIFWGVSAMWHVCITLSTKALFMNHFIIAGSHTELLWGPLICPVTPVIFPGIFDVLYVIKNYVNELVHTLSCLSSFALWMCNPLFIIYIIVKHFLHTPLE